MRAFVLVPPQNAEYARLPTQPTERVCFLLDCAMLDHCTHESDVGVWVCVRVWTKALVSYRNVHTPSL